MKHSKSFIGALFFFLFLIFSGCGGDGGSSDESEPPSVDVTGDWSGTWSSSNGKDTGDITLILTQSGSTVSGQLTFTGSPCMSGGNFSGEIAGNMITGSITTDRIQINLKITITDNQMNGTHNTTNVDLIGICFGYGGTFIAYKQ